MAHGTLPESHARFFGKAGAVVMRVPDKLTAGLSPVIAAYAATPEGADFNVPDVNGQAGRGAGRNDLGGD